MSRVEELCTALESEARNHDKEAAKASEEHYLRKELHAARAHDLREIATKLLTVHKTMTAIIENSSDENTKPIIAYLASILENRCL